MPDDLYRILLNGGSGGRIFRRKKKHEGATWTPTNESALSGDGVWCPAHRQFHGYMSKAKLRTAYEKRNGIWYIQWICKQTGNVLKEQGLGT